MADNETNIGNPSVDVDIIPKVVALDQSVAQIVRAVAELKPVIYARVAIDRQVTGGVGEQVQRAVDEATKHLQFAFSGLLKSNTDIRTLEDSLRSMMTVSEEAGQKLQAVFTAGARGGPQFKISTAQDVGPALEAMQRHRADFPAEQMRLRVGGSALDQARYGGAARAFSGITEPAVDKELQREREATIKATAAAAQVEADLARARLNTIAKEQEEHTKAQGSFGAGWDKAALAEKQQLFREEKIEADINIRQKLAEVAASKALVEAKRNELNLAQRIGAGQPLRRAIAPAITGALGGSDAAAITGGIMAMVMQSMMFRVGWMAMAGLENLPRDIGKQVDWGRYAASVSYRSTEAMGPEWLAEQGQLRRLWSMYRVGDKNETGDEVAMGLQQAYQQVSKEGTPAAEASENINRTIALSLGPHAFVQNPLGFITALARMHSYDDPKARQQIVQEPWLMDRFISDYAKRPEYAGVSREEIERRVVAGAGEMQGRGGFKPVGYIGSDLIDAEIGKVIGTDPRIKGMLHGQSEEWRQRLWGPRGREVWHDVGELNPNERGYVANKAHDLYGAEHPWKQFLGMGPPVAFGSFNYDAISAKRRAELDRYALGETGHFEKVPGLETGKETKLPALAPLGHMYQFSSITGLAEQMQMMASGGGIPEQQLSEAQKTNALLTDINNKTPAGSVHHAPLGAQPAISGAR